MDWIVSTEIAFLIQDIKKKTFDWIAAEWYADMARGWQFDSNQEILFNFYKMIRSFSFKPQMIRR